MKRIMQALVASWALATPIYAENVPVVVELFTSQGCSACPPADEMMGVLAGREDVIALSLHVDYWDYIGWKDEFADPGHAERQRAYAAVSGRRTVYTPEMIVNGVSDIVGAKPMAVATAIEDHKEEPRTVAIVVSRENEEVHIRAQALSSDTGPMVVQMLRYQPKRVSNITRGENAGRTMHYFNVAQDWQVLQSWDGEGPLEINASAPGTHPIVVIVQAENHGPILAAAQVR